LNRIHPLIALAVGVAIVLVVVEAASSARRAPTATGPIKIGISLSLTGDFSDPAKAAQRGYKLWAKTVNARGGVLGRKVQLIIRDDTSSPTQAASNYQTFITKDHVELVFGPFSTLLSAPSGDLRREAAQRLLHPACPGRQQR
jgi:branched-chain amino acid transport system substrate-binding protein